MYFCRLYCSFVHIALDRSFIMQCSTLLYNNVNNSTDELPMVIHVLLRFLSCHTYSTKKSQLILIDSISEPKQKSGKRNQVVVLTTIYPVKGITLDDNAKKTALLKLYDYNKTGIDFKDQRVARRKYSSKTKSNR